MIRKRNPATEKRHLKIYYIHTSDIAAPTPSATFVLNTVIALADAGADVTGIFTCSTPQSGELLLREKFGMKIPENLQLQFFHKNEDYSNRRFYHFVTGILEQEENAIVITRSIGLVPALLRSRKAGQRIVFETHDSFWSLGDRKDVPLKRKIRQWIIEHLYFRKLDALLHLSEIQKSLYDRYLPSVPKIVATTGFPSSSKKSNPRFALNFIYVGSMDKRKGIEKLIRFAGKFGKQAKFWFIGAKSESERRFWQSRAESVQAKVEIHNWMDKASLEKYLRKSSFGLIALEDSFFNRYLTVPLKIFDYWSAGLPVLVSDFPALTQFIVPEENGLIIDWDNPEDAIRYLQKMTKNPGEYQRMQRSVVRFRQGYGWSDRAERIIRSIRDLWY